MIRRLWHRVICSVTGRACTPDYPSSRDLQKEMNTTSVLLEAQTERMRAERYRITQPTGNFMADRLRGIVEEGTNDALPT